MFSGLQVGCIPKGKGQWLVGCADYMWGNGIKGGFIRLFYPIEKDELVETDRQPTWMPDKEYVVGMIKYAKLPSWLLGNVFYWLVGNVQLDSYWNATLYSPDHVDVDEDSVKKKFQKLPCIVFSHGLGGNRCLYSSFCLELASYGYVVAAIEHRDKSASATYYFKETGHAPHQRVKEWIYLHKVKENEDEFQLRNNQVHQRAKECMQALNFLEQLNEGQAPRNLLGPEFDALQFKDRLNLDEISIVGHSFGGVTSVAALAKDKRFKCGIALDAWMFPLGDELYHHTINQPLLFINTETFHWKKNIKQIMKLLKHDSVDRIMVTIKGTSHMNQCDLPLVVPSSAMRFMGVSCELGVHTIIDIHKTIIATFLSKYFGLGKEFSDEKILTEESQHVIIGSNLDVEASLL